MDPIEHLATMLPVKEHRMEWVRKWRLDKCVVLCCLLFLVVDRWVVLDRFGFRYADDDQTIMWNGAEEMAHGHFREPLFYGQRYNTMLEGLLAVPLLWAGLSHSVALPAMVSLMSLFPFLLLAGFMVKEGRWMSAGLVLLMPLALPVEYSMISSMPRGFVSGLFLSAFAVLPLFCASRFVLSIAAFAAVMAVAANPNSTILLVPVWLLIWLQHGHGLKSYPIVLSGALPAGLLWFLARRFYTKNPAFQVHQPWELDFDAARITWPEASGYLADVVPFVWHNTAILILLFAGLITVLLVQNQLKAAVCVLVGMGFIVAAFGVNKVHDGIPSVFYSRSRMFLAIPVLLAVFLSQARWPKTPLLFGLLLLVSGAMLVMKLDALPGEVAEQVQAERQNDLQVVEVDELTEHCEALEKLSQRYEANLIVLGFQSLKHMTNYGCRCLRPDFPETMEPQLDRRTWKLRELGPRVERNVLFACFLEGDMKGRMVSDSNLTLASTAPLAYVLKGNTLRCDSLMRTMGMAMREH